MKYRWRELDVFLPVDMPRQMLRNELRTRVIATADAGGEFVLRIKISHSEKHSADWTRWRISYLPGPPGLRRLRSLCG